MKKNWQTLKLSPFWNRTINGKEIEGKVKEKEQAKHEFEAAKSKGQSAGHIVAK